MRYNFKDNVGRNEETKKFNMTSKESVVTSGEYDKGRNAKKEIQVRFETRKIKN